MDRETTLHKLHKDNVLVANESSNARVEAKRRLRVLAEQQREIDTIKAMEQQHSEHIARTVQEEQELMLAAELERMKHEQVTTEKRRQQLRESSVELRELEGKLKAAYVNKELHAQRAEKELAARTDKETALLVDRELDKRRQQEEDLEQIRRLQVGEVNKQHQTELLQQIGDQQTRQQQAYEEFLKEKMMIDEIVQQIQEEDLRAREHELQRKAQSRKEMEETRVQQDQWKSLEAEAMANENERIMQYAQTQAHREVERRRQVQARSDQRSAVQDHIRTQLSEQQEARLELERLHQELAEEEQHERERQRERAALEAKIRQRLAIQQNEVEDLALKQRQKAVEKEEEEEFRRAMMDKFALDDKLEQMNAQKRRMRQLEHKKAVEALIDERRTRFQFEKDQQRKEAEVSRTVEAARLAVIEEERQRLLREHAHRLLGFLPKGVLRDQGDVEQLGDKFKVVYAPQQSRYVDDDE